MFNHRINRIVKTGVLFTIILLISALFFWDSAFADVPQQVFFQARVKKGDGTTVSGSHSFNFRLYSASSGGSSLWSEKQTLTADASGIVSGYLGSATSFPSTLDFNSTYYLSIEVDSDGEMSPRIKVVPSLSSLNSDRFDGLNSLQFLRSDTADTMEGTLTFSAVATDITTGTDEHLALMPNGSGNVGIGTTSPTGKLDVQGDEVRIWTGSGTNTNATSSGELYVEGDLEVDGTTYLADSTSTGNLTIQKADPSVILDVTTATDTDYWLGVQDDAGSDDDDVFVIGDGTSPGTNNFFAINTSGNVGIGTTAPVALLQAGTSPSPGLVVFAGGNVGIGTTSPVGLLHVGSQSVAPLYVASSTGNVGIGTTGPSEKLDVVGNIELDSTAATRKLLAVGGGLNLETPASEHLYFDAGGNFDFRDQDASDAVRVRIESGSGNVGIGTASPVGLLQAGTSPSPGLLVTAAGNLGIGTTSPVGLLHVGSQSVAPLYVASSTGNVGIGTTGPGTLLELSAASAAFLRITDTTNTVQWQAQAGDSDAKVGTNSAHDFYLLRGGTDEVLLTATALSPATNDGSALGTSSLMWGDLFLASGGVINLNNGDVTLTHAANVLAIEGGNVGIGTASPVGLLQAGTSPSPGLLVTAAGNLGIGTTSPSSLLELSGSGASLTFSGTGNHDVSASAGTLRIGAATIIGDISALNNTIDMGSAGTRFGIIYADEVNATTLVGTISGGNVSAATVTINSDNATADTEDSNLAFERGTSVPNALITWNSTNDYLDFNTGITIGSAIGSGNLGIGTTAPVALLQAGTAPNSSGLIVLASGNVGIGTTAPSQLLEINGDLKITGDDLFMATNTSGAVLVADGTNFNPVVMGGDATIGTTGTVAIAADAVALTTDTTGNYVKDVADGTGIDGTAAAEGATYTPTLDLTEISSLTWGAGAFTTMTFDAGTTDPVLTAKDGSLNLSTGNLGIGTTAPVGLLQAGTSPNAGLVVTAAGSVGIGVTTPTGRLDIRGDEVNIWTGAGTNTNATSSGELYVEGDLEVDGSLYAAAQTSTGNLTVNKADPSLILDVTTATDTDFWLGVQDDAGSDDDDLFMIGDGTTPGTNPFLTIKTDGNVGIGTTGPSDKLHISGSERITGTLAVGTTVSSIIGIRGEFTDTTNNAAGLDVSHSGANLGTGYGGKFTKTGGSTTNIALYATASGATNNYGLIVENGNVGIGTTSPLGLLQAGTAPNSSGLIVLAGGNVGIGTTAPAQLLEINGDLKITGDDLFMATNTSGAVLVADGTNFNPVVMGGDATIGTTGTVAIAADAVALTTDTSGNYVKDVADGTGIDGTAAAEGATYTPTLDLTEISSLTWGAGAFTTMTFDAGTTDPVLTAKDGSLNLSTGNLGIGTTAPVGLLQAGTSPNAGLVVTAAGSVGIGVTTPTGRLDIRGDEVNIWTGAGTNTNAVSSGELYVEGDLEVDATSYLSTASIGTSGMSISGAITSTATGQNAFDGNIKTAGDLAVNGGDITSTGALTVTPGAGTNLNIVLSTTGDFIVDTDVLVVDTSAARVGIGTTAPAYKLELSSDSAGKPSTNTWQVSSDMRIKKNIADFDDGLDVVMQLKPRTYQYNGLGGPGYNDADTHIGFVAQELEPVAPYMVETRPGTIGGKQVSDFKSYQGHALPFVLVNAVQEQQAQIEAQRLEIEMLKQHVAQLREKMKI